MIVKAARTGTGLNIYQRNYARLVSLGVCSPTDDSIYKKSRVSSIMDLVVEYVHQYEGSVEAKGKVYSLAHYFIQNGDSVCDPKMVVLVDHGSKIVEPLTFEMSGPELFGPPIYKEVYPKPGITNKETKTSLNAFLELWLNKLTEQGHGKDWEVIH